MLDGRSVSSLAEDIREYETVSGEKVWAATDKGINYGDADDVNQDRVGVNPDGNLVVVADGMGGYKHGDIAAQYVTESLLVNPDNHLKGLDVCRDRLVREQDPDARNSKTCFASVQITKNKLDQKYAKIVRAGDVKVLILRGSEIVHESKDENATQKKLDEGKITKEQAPYDDERHLVTNWVSAYSDNKDIEIPNSIRVNKGDIIIVITDGISDNLTPQEIIKYTRGAKPNEIIHVLSRLTNMQMTGKGKFKMPGKPDNRGAVVIQIN